MRFFYEPFIFMRQFYDEKSFENADALIKMRMLVQYLFQPIALPCETSFQYSHLYVNKTFIGNNESFDFRIFM